MKAKRRTSKYVRNDDTVAARQAYSTYDRGVLPDEIDDNVSPDQLTTGFYKAKVVVTPEEAKTIDT